MAFDEKKYVQTPIIDYVKEATAQYSTTDGKNIVIKLGWEYVSPDEATKLRNSTSNIIFRDVFLEQLKKLNPFLIDDNQDVNELIKAIENVPANINGNQQAWEYLKGLRTVFVQNEKRSRNVKLIDEINLDNNKYQITDEFTYENVKNKIRADLVFLINGIPILLIETKAPIKQNAMNEALDQIKRYHTECPKLMSVLQLYALTNYSQYYYSATWNISNKSLFLWKNDFQNDFEAQVKTFFSRENIVRLLMDYILFAKEDDELKKIVLRPHQIRAVNKILDRAKDENKNRGLVWHTQGSGKTYTMIIAAQKIIENPIFDNPTVILLVDRNELESQLFFNIKAVGIENVTLAESINNLETLLKSDKRGLIVSMIHKFEGIEQNINNRNNIFVMIDEAHRSTTGKLGNLLLSALPNAKFIGFTGTPIDRSEHGKGTFETFGQDDPPHGYLDKYSIRESIDDGTTVPLYYTLAPNKLLVDKETLEEEFWQLAEAEGVSDIETLNSVLDKAVNLRNMLKNKDRIEKVSQFVSDHYKNNVEPLGYKAFLVAVDREACALYKNELDKYFSPDDTAVVYSSNYNDLPYLSQYYLSKDEEKQIRKKFRNPESNPKILIVTEKLLTGFDAPILYCMYLDKPMRDHVLLQAIARVNRPYEDKNNKKTCGLIVDFIGIFDNLQRALAFDSTDIDGIYENIDALRDKFAQLIEIGKKDYLSIFTNIPDDQQIAKILDYFRDSEERKRYYEFFKSLSHIYDILSPDSFLGPYLEIYDDLTKIYLLLIYYFNSKIEINNELNKKTIELVKNNTKNTNIGKIKKVYKIDGNSLKKIDQSYEDESDIEKIYNLNKTIQFFALNLKNEMPFILSIGEKAQNIVDSYNQRQIGTNVAIKKLEKLHNDIKNIKKEPEELNMSNDIYTIYYVLNEFGVPDAENKAKKIENFFSTNPYWRDSKNNLMKFRQELYKILDQIELEKKTDIVNKIINLLKNNTN